ncbi:MAG: HNH endonuclease [Alteromonadaceae bacterium]|nr:HNH endonuclease [Alteromonadaceae bacterium]
MSRRPYCECPHCLGKFVKGEVVDHIEPHRGDAKIFFDSRNLQTLTKLCHDSMKQSSERGGAGFSRGCDVRGNPIGAEHWT